MADYISTLTGVQVDAGLLELAQHNSEAWAVGQRSGINVSSADETFQNNSKYYASRGYSYMNSAIAAANRAESAVPAGTAGAVFFDRAQSLTDSQKEQARANISAVNSNPNILINSWFGENELLNTYLFTEGYILTSTFPIFPKWETAASAANLCRVTLIDDCVKLDCNSASWMQFKQKLDNPELINGKVVTLSLLTRGGSVYSGSVTRTNGTQQIVASESSGGTTEMELMFTTNDEVQVSVYGNGSFYIRGIKLEFGSACTILTDVPQTKGENIARCGGYGLSNRNLLDNPWWGKNEVIDQRGYSNGSATLHTSVYCIDRWKQNTSTDGSGMFAIGIDGGWLIAPSGSGAFGNVSQIMENPSIIDGKTVTLSAYVSGYPFPDYIVSGTFVRENGTTQIAFNKQISNGAFSGQINNTNKVVFQVSNGADVVIRAVKLELGSYSTLINDTPPDYGEELAKCQRYFIRITSSSQAQPVGFGVQSSSTSVRLLIPTPVTMRAMPSTIPVNGTARVYGGTAASRTVTSYQPVDKTASGIGVVANITAGTFLENYAYVLYLANGAYIDLSADL